MFLAKDVFLAQVGARSIALDLDKDRYIGLSEDLTRELMALLDAPSRPVREDTARQAAKQKLVEKGILAWEGRAPATPPVSLRTRSLWPPDPPAIPPPGRMLAVAGALFALGAVARRLHHSSFAETIAWLQAQKYSCAQGLGRGCVQTVIQDFATARPWFPESPICRLDAPALCLYLWGRGVAADLVFGVRLDPFAAHCWAQVGEAVACEPHDTVRQYTPILQI